MNNESKTDASISMIEFVGRCFVPEFVALKRAAGRAHFQSILKHILTPGNVDRLFAVDVTRPRNRLTEIPGWPYMDSTRLRDVTTSMIQHVISTALGQGYSVQTVTHIRNVIRAIFAYAREIGIIDTENPAESVRLPGMMRKEPHSLTLEQLKRVIQLMRSPEREIALLALLTKMSVAEICGLQWKYVNLSDNRRIVDGNWLPARTISIRKQSYRGKFSPVLPNRQRSVAMPELICSVFGDLCARSRFTGPEDFVLSSRSGSPISQDNVAMRRLKAIGKTLAMPWLSWYVFHRTHTRLLPAAGRQLQNELKKAITLERIVVRQR
jgi:integrase